MRALDPEEAALWSKVAATIRPLSRERKAEPAQSPVEHLPVPSAPPALKGAQAARKVAPPAPPPRPGTTLDATWDRKLARGSIAPDRVIDLHGHNLDRAWGAIDDGLEQAIGAGERVVLLITGHARSGEPPIARGRIRAAVHDWLAHSRHARHIAAVRAAHGRHGGGGSLYLILRRPRASSTFP